MATVYFCTLKYIMLYELSNLHGWLTEVHNDID